MTMRCFAVIAVLFFAAGAWASDLPDPKLTPGVVRSDLTVAQICATKWGTDRRMVTSSMRKEVLRRYGLQKCDGELDHLISREVGGADDPDNLWCQTPWTGGYSAKAKDRAENRIHKELCAGNITLQQAHGMLLNDWRVAYRHYFGEPKP